MIYFKILVVLQLSIIFVLLCKVLFISFFLIRANLAVNPFNDFYSVLCLKARSYLMADWGGAVAVNSCL